MKLLLKYNPSYIFTLVFVAFSLLYNYHEDIFTRPHSLHSWRQADCGAIALNYYQDGMNFFQPEIHQQNADGGESGHNISEFPIIYYFVASLYHVFGYHEFVFRIVSLLIFYLGLLYLFKLFRRVIKDDFWAILLSSSVFLSFITVYYAISYLPNTSALAFVFIGWYFFYLYYEDGKNKNLIKAFVFFLIAALLKITAGISPLAIFGLFVLEKVFGLKLKNSTYLFKNSKIFLFVALGFVLLSIAWYYYVFWFNNLHETSYFGTRIWPIWEMSINEINEYKPFILRWVKGLLRIELQIFLLVCIPLLVYFRKYVPRMFGWTLIFVSAGVFSYLILWYSVLKIHDYYFINLILLPVLMFLVVFVAIRNFKIALIKNVYLKVFAVIFFLYLANNTRSDNSGRQEGYWEPYVEYENLYDITPCLREIGLSKDDRVISVPDNTPCLSLYLINQKGWTLTKEPMYYEIQKAIKNKPKYLIVNGEEYLSEPILSALKLKKIGNCSGVTVFKIQY